MEKETLAARFKAIANARPEQAAITDSTGCQLTYGELLCRAEKFARYLLAMCSGDPNIGIYLPAGVPAAVVNYGITIAGKTAVNLNFTAGRANCAAARHLCELKTIVTSRAFIDKLGGETLPEMVFLENLENHDFQAGLPTNLQPDQTACILFSSGSTGTPKGIELTHWNVLANAEGLASRIPPAPDDCVLGVLPFFHSFGYTFALWFPVLHGIRAVYHANPTDAKIIGQLAHEHRATHFFSTPSFCQQYAAKVDREKFATLRYIIVGAEKLRPSTAKQFREHFGIELLAGYGCTELGPGVAINTPSESKPGSVGRPLEGIEVRVADPDTLELLPVGQEGVILINGPSRMPGYYQSPGLTRQVLRDGFYVTGDIGYVDADGFLYITDRMARFSKVAGEMVPHLRLEEAVSDMTPAFVTGVPDERRGERLVMLYTNPEVTAETIQRRLQTSELPPLWIPKREDMYLVENIPVLANGKVDLKGARAVACSRAQS